ncbi:MAG: PIN domain-containing protein [Eubacteriales bacterium]|nr:PIN domain-containing protein [Eubacteriales bacterium]
MGYYLIDYENTKKSGLKGIENLAETDTVVLFYSENADTLTFEMHQKINESKADFQLQQAIVGTKNALDFELVTYLGYVIGQNRKEHYYIVSGDKGFQSVCKYWAARKVRVSLISDLTGRDEAQERSRMIRAVEEAVGKKENAGKIADIIQNYKTKQGINNALMRMFPSQGNKLASEYYKAIKPLIRNKKGRETHMDN